MAVGRLGDVPPQCSGRSEGDSVLNTRDVIHSIHIAHRDRRIYVFNSTHCYFIPSNLLPAELFVMFSRAKLHPASGPPSGADHWVWSPVGADHWVWSPGGAAAMPCSPTARLWLVLLLLGYKWLGRESTLVPGCWPSTCKYITERKETPDTDTDTLSLLLCPYTVSVLRHSPSWPRPYCVLLCVSHHSPSWPRPYCVCTVYL